MRLTCIIKRSASHELPDVLVEGTVLLLNAQKCPRVPDRTLHFEPVAHDAGVLEQTLDTRRRELGHSRRMEVGEQPPIVRSFLEDGGPAQASLSGFEDQEFEQSLIV